MPSDRAVEREVPREAAGGSCQHRASDSPGQEGVSPLGPAVP